MLGNVLLLCFFVFFIFGIVGVQLWAGLLRNRCVINLPRTNFTSELADMVFNNTTLTRYYIPEDTSLDYICSQPDASGLHTCSNLPAYFDGKTRCNLTLDQYDKVSNGSCINWNIYYNECRVMHKNPFQGSVSFDNIGFAWVAIFLVCHKRFMINRSFSGYQFGRMDRFDVPVSFIEFATKRHSYALESKTHTPSTHGSILFY